MDSNTAVYRYALDVILYATGGEIYIYKSHFLSTISVCYYNGHRYVVYVDLKFTDGSSIVDALNFSKF